MDKKNEKKPFFNRSSKVSLSLWLLLGSLIIFGSNSGKDCGIFQEDGLLEWIQVVFLLGASAVLFYIFYRRLPLGECRNGINFIAAVFLLWIGLEEISYGQRLFGFEAPYYFLRENAHREVNIHNLPLLDRASEIVTTALLILWGILLPVVASTFSSVKSFCHKHRFIMPTLTVAAFCAGGLLLELLFRRFSLCYWPCRNEITETFLYGAFLVTAVEYLLLSDCSSSEEGNCREEIE